MDNNKPKMINADVKRNGVSKTPPFLFKLMSPLQSPPPSLPAHPPSLSSTTSFTTTTNNTSSSSSSSSTTITPSTLHNHIKYFPSPIARPSSNMSTSTNSSSTSATSTSTSASDSSSAVSAPSLSSMPLHLSAHTRDFSAPQSATLRVSQSQSHIRSSSAGIDNAISSGNSYNNISSSISTASSPVFNPFVSPQLDSGEGGTSSPLRDTRPSQSRQSVQQPFSPRLLSFLRAQSQEHERNSSAGSGVSSSSTSTKANSITSSSTGSYSSVEIISHSNEASVNNVSTFNVSSASASNSGFGYARQVVFGSEEPSGAAVNDINTASSMPPSSSPVNSTFHSNSSSMSTNMLMNSYSNNANASSTYVTPSNNMNQMDNTDSPNAYSNANNANNADPTFSVSTNDFSSYHQFPNTPDTQFSFQNFKPNSHSSSPVSSSPLSSQFSISGQPSLSSNNSVGSQTSGSAMAMPQQQQQQQQQQPSLNANYRDSYSSSNSSPSPLTSSTATVQAQNQVQIQSQQQFDGQTIAPPIDALNAPGDSATTGLSTSTTQNSQGLTPNVYINGLPPHFPDESLYLMTRDFGTVKSVRTFTRHVGERLSGYGFVLFETMDAAEKCINSLRRYRNLHPSFSKQFHKIPGTQFSATLPSTFSSNSNMSSAGSLNSIASSQSYASSVSSGTSYSTGACADENASSGVGGGNGSVDDSKDFEKDSFRLKMERLKDINSTNLYLEGLPLSIDENTLAALVAPHQIKSSRFFQTKLSDPPRIIAFVRFETRQAAEDIIERLHGRVVRGWNDNGSRISVRFADSNEQRELRRAERLARGEDEDPASKGRLTMAQAALLNIRGAQVQAQLQNQAKLNVPNSVGFAGAESTDRFGRLQSNPNRRTQLPIHPLTLSPPLTSFAATPGMGTAALPTNFSLYQQNDLKAGGRYAEPFTSATNAQTQAQAQEYARLLESMSLTGMNLGGAGLEMDFDTNAAAVAATTLRNGRSSVFKVPDFQQPATAVPILPKDTTAMSPALMAHAQTLAMLQQQREQELIRLQQHQQSRGLRQVGSGSAINVDSNVNMRSILDPASNAFDTARMLAQQQIKYQRRQQSSFGVDLANSMASPMTDGNYMSSPEFSDPRGQLPGVGTMANNSQRHSAPSNFSSFLHQAADRHARNHSVSVEQHQQQHQQHTSNSERGTPFVSPALTYASRTPATLSPATPFFNAFNTPAIHQNQNQKASVNAGGGAVSVVGVDGGTTTNRGLKNDFQN